MSDLPQIDYLILYIILPLLFSFLSLLSKRNQLIWIMQFCCFIPLLYLLPILYGYLAIYNDLRYSMGNWDPPYGIELRLDYLNFIFLILLSIIGFVTILFQYNSKEIMLKESYSKYSSLFLICFAGLNGMVLSNDAFNIYVFMEIFSLSAYALTTTGPNRLANLAAFQYLFIGTIGSIFYLLGVGFIYMSIGSLNLSDIAIRIADVQHLRYVQAGMYFITIGILIKAGIFPFHFWLTQVYSYGKTNIVAFFSGTSAKVMLYLLIRYFYYVFDTKLFLITLKGFYILSFMAFGSIIFASIVALYQTSIRRIYAYSSISQMGYALLCLCLLSKLGLIAAIIISFYHGIIKSFIFHIINFFETSLLKEPNKKELSLSDMTGVSHQLGFVIVLFVIASFALIGSPLTIGFVGKIVMFNSFLELKEYPLFILLAFTSILPLIYLWRILEPAYFQINPKSSSFKFGRVSEITSISIVLLIFYFGLNSNLLYNMAEKATNNAKHFSQGVAK